jgi:predicted 3-demethylubiquinone-9 3-methyltransferase (glyoxalase superfamily)
VNRAGGWQPVGGGAKGYGRRDARRLSRLQPARQAIAAAHTDRPTGFGWAGQIALGGEAHRPHSGDTPMNKVTPFLMFNDQLEAAIEFYTATFPNSEVRNVARTGKDGPISSAEFVVGGQHFMGYNGGPYFSFSEGVSLYVDCADQDEVDEYWDKLLKAGAKPTQCGWIKDPFGLSWQIVPRRFTELIGDRDPGKVKAVMEAMMTMVKLDVAELERAYNEA